MGAEPTPADVAEVVAEAEAATLDADAAVAEAESAVTEAESAEAKAESPAEAGLAKAVALLRPGDVAETPIAVWTPDAIEQMRAEWRAVQELFIDEPETAVAKAHELVTKAVHALADSLLAVADLDVRKRSERPDTEELRVAMRRYRDFLDRVLAL